MDERCTNEQKPLIRLYCTEDLEYLHLGKLRLERFLDGASLEQMQATLLPSEITDRFGIPIGFMVHRLIREQRHLEERRRRSRERRRRRGERRRP